MLTGKTCLITGVASGIGLRTAELAMHQGAAPERPPTSRPWLLFAASGAAHWINGANVPADGGLEAPVLASVMDF
jgi:NAD(P)-dependent dehydrogenase (short-subunit alcohol dehydrogenase family)